MKNLQIGKSGIEVPFLGMGTWAIGGGAWWGDNDDSLSVKAIQTAVEQGIRWIDTAPIYGLYHSEEVVGEAMKHIDRDKVVLSTKCGLEWRHETPVLHKVVDGVTVYRDLSAQSIIEDVEDSLRRLHTDHLDVLYTHWQSPDFGLYPLEATVEAMMKLKDQGKIRAIGASNVTSDIIRGYCKYGQLDVIQEKYSLLTRRVEKQLLPTCRELGVSVQAYSPLEQGIQWIDTAPIYGLYHSETVVGEAMKHIDRDKVVLSTKCGLEWRHESPILHKVVDGVQVYRDLSAKSIIEDVEDSLRRLHTDHLDVLYTHWQSPDFGVYPLEETMEAMMKLKEQGKIRAIGASNVTSDIIRGYCKYGQLDVIQEKYSLLTRRIEKQLLPTCKELGVSVQAYSPLEQGLLTGKVTMDTTYPEGSTRNSNPNFQPARRAQALAMLNNWQDLTEKYHCTMAQLVIALTARMVPGLFVLCGARTPQQAADNAGAMHIHLDGADAVRMKWDVDSIS